MGVLSRYRNTGQIRGLNVGCLHRYMMADRIPHQIEHMSELVKMSDADCFDNLRMDRSSFNRLYVTVGEQVALFLSVLSHHSKVRVVKFSFKRSGQTIHTYFHNGCLGALDGTLIDVTVPEIDKARYHTRKGTVSVNVLIACDRGMHFIYMLASWEGSAADARVLRDAIVRDDGLRVPHGNFYLCDNGYPNGEGFLTPYKMVRYHLHEWGSGPSTPQNYKEYYNMHHSKARNVIERTFGLFKKQWAILRSPSFYPISVQNKIILACTLIHNFLRNEMPDDPLGEGLLPDTHNQEHDEELIDSVQPSLEWTSWRDTLAHEMYNRNMDSGTADQLLKPLRNRKDNGRMG
ncbi:hypothetical protein ACS0TY_020165 [Phlomoides rotata]